MLNLAEERAEVKQVQVTLNATVHYWSNGL